jgi:hypothetical protein
MTKRLIPVLMAIVCSGGSTLFGGFASTEVFLPAVGRVAGKNGAQFYTTVWATNLTSAPQTFTFQFLKGGQSNLTPASFEDTLAPGQTRMYENIVETKLGLASALGAARITSGGEIFVSERIYDQAPGDGLGKTVGLFFAGVPKTFSIAAGQSASIQGVNQGGSEDFRYNFALVETGGGSPTVGVQVFDGSGALLGQRSFPMLPFEQLQPAVSDVVPGIATTNARITATVTGGTGSVLLAGAQVANGSQDSSGFEMSFRDGLLGGGGQTGVASLNGLTGALTLAAGSNVSITPSGSQITISATGNGGGGGLALPFNGTVSAGGTAFHVTNPGSGGAIEGDATGGIGVHGVSGTASGVYGRSTKSIGVGGQSDDGDGVSGFSATGYGVVGSSGSSFAMYCEGDGLITGAWAAVSDSRFKKNVENLDGALDRTLALRGVTFDWRRDEFPDRHFSTRPGIGFIAQEVEAIYPELVMTGRDGYKSVDYAKVGPILVEAIKAQQKVIEDLTRRLERLEAERRGE